MSTWWTLVPREDLGLRLEDLPGRPFAITNRGWYVLHRFLKAAEDYLGLASDLDPLLHYEAFIPSRLAVQWGRLIGNAATSDGWMLVGRFNGRAVVADRIAHIDQTRGLGTDYELTPLAGTPAYHWLLAVGQELATTPTGYLMSGKPRKGTPMSQSLVKGEKVDLQELATKAGATGGLSKLRVAAGWDVRQGEGPEFDLDLVLIGCDANGKAVNDDWRIFFNNKKSPGDAIIHHGDNLTGAGDGDDETADVDLSALPAEVVDLRIYVTIYEAKARGDLNFGVVNNAFVRILDQDNGGTELSRFDLTEDAGPVQSVELGKVYRKDDGAWQFRATAEKFRHELDGVFAAH
jgi:tellurium resistance protein TerD